MKIQQQTQNNVHRKRQSPSQTNTAFSSLFSSQENSVSAIFDPHKKPTTLQNPEQHQSEHNNQPLDKILLELEGIMQGLEKNSHDHQRAQLAINSLRDALHDMPQAFPLSSQDREEAKTLLAVESSRIELLRKYDDNY